MSTINSSGAVNQKTLYVDKKTIYIQRTEDTRTLTVANIGENITMSFCPDLPTPVDSFEKHTVDAVLGILPLKEDYYLLCVTSSTQIGFFGKHQISQVKDIKLFSLSRFPSKEFLDSILESLTQFISQGVYFSNTFDLSNSISTQKGIKEASTFPDFRYDLIEYGNPVYLANEKLLKFFKEKRPNLGIENNAANNLLSDFIANTIYGFVGFIDYPLKDQINNEDLKSYFRYMLISRRQVKEFGFYHYKRGIDSEGNCADEVETESIVLYDRNVFSFLITRGNPPVDYHKDINFLDTTDSELQSNRFELFSQYISGLIDQYSLVCFISLLNKDLENENLIECQLKSNLKTFNEEGEQEIKYLHINCNQTDTEHNSYRDFIDKQEKYLDVFKYFGRLNNGDLLEQSGLFRLACLNGERSNELQMKIVWKVLMKQLQSVGIDVYSRFMPIYNLTLKTSDEQKTEVSGFTPMYMKLWANNFNHLNDQYHPAINEESIKKIQRLINIVFKKAVVPSPEDDLVQRMALYEQLTWKKQTLTVSIHSWNVGSFDPRGDHKLSEKDINKWICPYPTEKNQYADLVIIGIQEVVKLNPQNVLITKSKTNQNIIGYWEKDIARTLRETDDYDQIMIKDLVGLVIIVYIKKKIKDQDPNFSINSHSIKTGMSGKTGNKGSCMVSIKYKQHTIAISCSHLAAGLSSNSHRLSELVGILEEPFPKQTEVKLKKFKDHDSYFVFGDLNFRIDNDIKNIAVLIENKDIKKLKTYDQLYKLKAAYVSLKTLDEGELTFYPTYKYNPGTNEIETKKERNPSWCDRILFKKCKHIQLVGYTSLHNTMGWSDHKPIYGFFKVEVKDKDDVEKKKLTEIIKEDLILQISSDYNFSSFHSLDFE